MAKEYIIFIFIGILSFISGLINYKYTKFMLEFFGARALIFFKEENRIKIMKFLGKAFMILGFILIVIGVFNFFL